MFTKKEMIIGGGFLIFFILLIAFLPMIESFFFRKEPKYSSSNANKENQQIEKYVCTRTVKSSTVRTTKELTFSLDKNTATKVISKETATYGTADAYQHAKDMAGSNTESEHYIKKLTFDDGNRTIIINESEEAQANNFTYPTKLEELKENMEKNNFICSAQYKKS